MRFPLAPLVSSSPLVLLLACGGNDPAPAPATKAETKEVEPTPPQPEQAEAGAEAGAAKDSDGGDDAFEDDWGSEGGAEAEGEPADEAGEPADDAGAEEGDPEIKDPFPGPCRITWSTGAALRFKYTESGGTVRVDEDGDKKSDVCGSWQSADGRTTSMKIDQGCNKKTDTTITPKYDTKANVATAKFSTTDADGNNVDRELTLVTIPGYVGLTPGYPLYGSRKASGVKVSKGLVRSATVKSPWEGPAMKVAFSYDKKGRVSRIKEDHERDGSTDRRFDYKYDTAGNVTRVSVVIGSGEAQQKGRARLSYSCHKSE